MQRERLPLYTLVLANATSLTGNVLAVVAIPWFVLVTTGSAAKTGVAAFATTAPYAIGAFFGGALVNRLGAKRTSVASDIASAVSVAAIPVLHLGGVLEFWNLLLLAFLGGLFDSPGAAARVTLVPELAERAGVPLERANSLYTATEHTGYVVGAPLGGVLVALLGAPNALWIDAASFVLSAVAVAVALPAIAPAVATGVSYAREIVDGLRFMRREPVVLASLFVTVVGSFLISPLAPVILPVYAKEEFGDAEALGVMIGAYGFGGLLGTLLFGAAALRIGRSAFFYGMWVAYPLVCYLLIPLPGLLLALAALLAIGLLAGAEDPLTRTIRHERTPPELRGRVFGTVMAADMMMVPPGALFAGLLIEWGGLRASLVAFAVGNTLLAAAAMLSPARRVDPPPQTAWSRPSP